MKNKFPKLDLSKYNDTSRINSNVEVIIVNAIIHFGGNIKKVSEWFNMSEETIKCIYIKYLTHIEKIIDMNKRGEDVEITIENIIHMFKNNVEELKKNVDANPQTKILSDKMITNLNKIIDRCIELKSENNNQYDSTVNRLNDQIIKFKQLEVVEQGQIENMSDYLENQQSVLEKLMNYDYKHTAYLARRKRVQMMDLETGQTQEFESLQACADALGVRSGSICDIAKYGKVYKDKFKLSYI